MNGRLSGTINGLASPKDDILEFAAKEFPIWTFADRHLSSFHQFYSHGIADIWKKLAPASHARSARNAYEPHRTSRGKSPIKAPKKVRHCAELVSHLYEPLPSNEHIRLVCIKPATSDAQIEIYFSTVRLSEAGSFEALSYVWGPQEYATVKYGQKSLSVRRNLHEALLGLRDAENDRWLWIDALCINQDDLDERAQQVAMMRTIYASSARTVVWLGQAAMLSDSSMKVLSMLLENHTTPSEDEKEIMKGETVWSELGDLYNSAWFSRIWIIQEVVVAKHVIVQLGQELWKWEDFATASLNALYRCRAWQAIFDPISAVRLNQVRLGYQQDGPYATLLDTLGRSREACASLDQDKVYGVTGLTNDPFEIDYKESVANTYLRLAKTVIERGHAPSIFHFVDDHQFRLARGLPTWVPDWEVRQGSKAFHAVAKQPSNWLVSLNTAMQFTLSEDGRKLRVYGFVVDCLDRIGLPFVENVPVAGGLQRRYAYFTSQMKLGNQLLTVRRMTRWNNFKTMFATFYPDGQRQSAFLHTLTGSTTAPTNESDERLQQGFKLWSKVWVSAASNTVNIAMRAYSELAQEEVAPAFELIQSHVLAA